MPKPVQSHAPTTQTFGPFKGMRYRADPERRSPEFAIMATNMVPADPILGGAYCRRPNDQATTIKAASAITTQHLGVFRKRSGFVGVSVVDGEIYTLSGTTWTRQVTTANLTTASITLSATARVFAVSFNNTYVLNDGVNQPFTWDGTSGSGGLTLLSNAPTKCYGKPTVYYGKLFFIKDVAASSADRSKIVWSEEYAANTGYEAGGYNNAWILEQSGSGALYAIVGTNNGLYYYRQDAIGVIYGAVGPAFSTTGVHDDVSSTIGTTCPEVLWYESYLYFFDQYGRPQRLAEGAKPDPIYLELADLYTTPDTPGEGVFDTLHYDAAKSNVVPYPFLDGVVFAAYNSTDLFQTTSWLFSHRSGYALCRIGPQAVATPTITGTTYDTTNGRTAIAFDWLTLGVAKAYVSPVISGSFFDSSDTTEGRGGSLGRSVVVGPYGAGPEQVWHFQQVSVMAAVGATASPVTGEVAVVIGTGEAPYATQGATLGSREFTSGNFQTQIRKTWDTRERQRFAPVSIADGGGFEGWGVYQVSVDAILEEIEPGKT